MKRISGITKRSISTCNKIVGILLMAVVVLTLIFVTACSGQTETKTQAPTGSAAAPTKTLNIGFAVALNAGTYLDALRAAELLIEQDNNAGGLQIGNERYKINLIKYDSGITQDTETTAINRLVSQDKVSFIITQGLAANAWVKTTDANKVMVLHFETAFAPLPEYKYIFNGSGVTAQSSALPGWICKNYPEEAKVYVLASPDDQMGHIVNGFVSAAFRSFGVEPNIIFYPAGTADFSSVATKIMSYNPTLFTCIGGNEGESGRAFTALRQSGSKAMFLWPPASPLQTLKDVLSPEALEGFVAGATPSEFDIPLSEGGKAFKDAWIAKYGSWTAPDMTDSTLYPCLRTALQKAGSIDVDKVAEVLNNGMEFDSPQGPMKMMSRLDVGNSKTVDSVGTNYIKKIVSGKATVLGTISPDETMGYYQKAHPALPAGATYTPPPGP
jgi:branched-chain amino acid transport system substrate-binding protein